MKIEKWAEEVERIKKALERTGGKLFKANRSSVEDEEYIEDGIYEIRSLSFEWDEDHEDIKISGEIRTLSRWYDDSWSWDEIASKEFPLYEGEYEDGWFETSEEAWQAIKDKIDDEISYEETVRYSWENR